MKSTKKRITVELQKAPKIIDQVKKIQKDVFLVGFKAEANVSKKDLINYSLQKLRESDADMIVANDIGTKYQFNPELNEIVIVDHTGETKSSKRITKLSISKFIRKQIEQKLR